MSTLLFESDDQRFTRCYEHASGYHHRARLLVNQTRSPSLVFNVAAIAVECYLIALCALHGDMPLNHNYRSLLRSIEEHIVVDDALRQSILSLDTVFGICSVDDYHHGAPDENDKVRILALCEELNALIRTEQAAMTEKMR
ncbi:hypothetical protein [Raoultella terrigena]|uniref:HEPN domain-containing protein n=1 Tax=Raoultella terrigena TaxID=577 RepID=A0A3P8KXY1_RAOTE|nr:hypothetical protein [Raoultella terrigena]VDR27322.1 Uncharacterised protein [Raoultella terrigena]